MMMKINAGKVVTYVLLALLVTLILVVIIMALIQAEDEHEFIKDVRKIKLDSDNNLLISICNGYNEFTGDTKNYYKMNAILHGISDLSKVTNDKNVCNKGPSKADNLEKMLKTTFSFSKLEAKQIYNNNNLIIDNVYNDKHAKECFRAFIQLVGPDLRHGYNKDYSVFEDTMVKDAEDFVHKYSRLDTRRQKYINIIISALIDTAKLQIL